MVEKGKCCTPKRPQRAGAEMEKTSSLPSAPRDHTSPPRGRFWHVKKLTMTGWATGSIPAAALAQGHGRAAMSPGLSPTRAEHVSPCWAVGAGRWTRVGAVLCWGLVASECRGAPRRGRPLSGQWGGTRSCSQITPNPQVHGYHQIHRDQSLCWRAELPPLGTLQGPRQSAA